MISKIERWPQLEKILSSAVLANTLTGSIWEKGFGCFGFWGVFCVVFLVWEKNGRIVIECNISTQEMKPFDGWRTI